jgi:hypothetical protein
MMAMAPEGFNEGLVKLLLMRGAKVDQSDRWGNTALGHAAYYGNPEAIELLASKGANVNHQNRDGETPLIKAAQQGCIKCVKALLTLGANKNLRDNSTGGGMTAGDWAKNKMAAVDEGSAANEADFQEILQLLGESAQPSTAEASSPADSGSSGGPSLEATLNYIREKVNEEVDLTVTGVWKDVSDKGTSGNVRMPNLEIRAVTAADVQACTVQRIRLTEAGTVRDKHGVFEPRKLDTPVYVPVSFAKVRKVAVVMAEEHITDYVAATSHRTVEVSKIVPQKVYVVRASVDDTDAPKMDYPFYTFYFRDGASADRVVKAITHAAELCGAGKEKKKELF